MENEQKRGYIAKLMYDIQKARSVFYEAQGGDTENDREIADTVGKLSEPWLFGERCLLPALIKALDGEIEDTLIMNLSTIAQHSQMLQIVGISSKRHDPTMEEIFEDLLE